MRCIKLPGEVYWLRKLKFLSGSSSTVFTDLSLYLCFVSELGACVRIYELASIPPLPLASYFQRSRDDDADLSVCRIASARTKLSYVCVIVGEAAPRRACLRPNVCVRVSVMNLCVRL